MKTPTGIILYDGPSMLDGERIVAIATLSTANRKTGNMVQTWILRADRSPVETSKAKLDSTICGQCPHRHSVGGACYVNIGQAPQSVWKAWQRGSYPAAADVDLAGLLSGRMLRLGAYGDPAAVPFEVWQPLVQLAAGHTGYTHQINHKAFDSRMLGLCMVSADTQKSAERAHELGARTFRIARDITDRVADEIECLSDSEGKSCADCGLCAGSTAPVNVVIQVHGSRAGSFLNNRKVA